MQKCFFEERKEINGTQYFIGHTKEYVKAAIDANAVNGQVLENELIRGKMTGFLEADMLLMQI